MPIEIIGAENNAERDAAEALAGALAPLLAPAYKLLIVVNAHCFGEGVEDIDLLLLGTFGRGIQYTSRENGESVRLVNLCMIIEVKDHSSDGVRFDGQQVKVLYSNGWSDATEQLGAQQRSLRRFLERNGKPAPWVGTGIWLRNYAGAPPAAISNLICGAANANAFLGLIERVRKPYGVDDKFISFSKNEAISDILGAAAFFHTKATPTRIDRKRMEAICKKVFSDQKYIERLGTQLLVFRGRGGSGKTIHLLRLAKDLYDGGNRVLLLTFNKALVADVRRLLVLLGISIAGNNSAVHISTAHKYFVSLLSSWALWPKKVEDNELFPAKLYTERKAELLQLLAKETPDSLRNEGIVQDHLQIYGWDYILVDEAQDWPEDERDLLYRFFGPKRCIVADGVDQLIRNAAPCDWTAPADARTRQTVVLRKAMRMKSNLCRFIRAFAVELGVEWDQEVNDEVVGGSVTILLGSYTEALHREFMARHRGDGNEPIDALFCVPPDGDDIRQTLPIRLQDWGLKVWDGTSKETRDTFPTSTDQHRVVKYESCRGLEGWTVVCAGLDHFYANRLHHADVKDQSSLFESATAAAHRQAAAWTLIPLTRAIDHLVLQVEGGGEMRDICQKLAVQFPDFVRIR